MLKLGGPAIDPSMLWPLLVMAVAFKAFYVAVLIMRMRAELAQRRLRALALARAA